MNILIIKTSALGDIVQSFDVLEYLKEKYPLAKIDWIASSNSKELIAAHPLVNKVICFDLKKEKKFSFFKFINFLKSLRSSSYDIVFDLQANSKSGLITMFAKGRVKVGFGAKSISEWPNLLSTDFQYDISKKINIRQQYLKLIQAYFRDQKEFLAQKRALKTNEKEKEIIFSLLKNPSLKGTKILVCPNAKWKNKELDFSALSDFLSLIDKNLNVSFLMLWGNEKEKEVAHNLFNRFSKNSILLDKLSLPVLQNLIQRLDLVIAMDSCPLHLAGSVDVPTFSFFGPSSASVYKPIGNKHFALQGECPFNKAFSKRCSSLRSCHGSCIKDFDPEAIFKVFKSWWFSIN